MNNEKLKEEWKKLIQEKQSLKVTEDAEVLAHWWLSWIDSLKAEIKKEIGILREEKDKYQKECIHEGNLSDALRYNAKVQALDEVLSIKSLES